jgi:hypothetical protein
MTKFRIGAVLGLAAGYYLGAKAGRDRYEQINRLLHRARRHEALDHAATAVGRARAVIDLTRERVVDLTDHKTAVAQHG